MRVFNLANPLEPGNAATWQHWDQHRDPEKAFARYVTETPDQIVGYGFSVVTDTAANVIRYAIFLLPEWNTSELIDQFNRYILGKCLDLSPSAVISLARENEDEKIAWLKSHGFQYTMRYPCSTLNVPAFDPGRYSDLKVGILRQGIEIVSLAQLLLRDPNWQRSVYDLEMLLSEDVPRHSGFSPPPFEKYLHAEFDSPHYLPEMWLVALDGDSYVGMTSLFKPGHDLKLLETGLTGVRRSHRRKGLATALKCLAIEVAQRKGTELILTFNEENNPMFQLNLKLGFVAQPADVDWKKEIAGKQ